MSYIISNFESGIKSVFKKINSPVAYCALTIKTGTRNESADLNGISHLTEHMLFKGTTKRGARAVNNFLERLGGELNAYTTKEETVIHATVLKEDISKAVELLSDLAFHSLYPEKELVKEKDIVLEEISSYKDTPFEQIFDDFDEFIFKKHPLAMPILGRPKSIKNITSEHIKEYTKRFYRPSNMCFSIVADITQSRAESLVDRYFVKNGADFQSPSDQYDSSINNERVELSSVGEFKRLPKKTHQSHSIVGALAYSMYDKKRLPLALLTNILGGPALNSKLNHELREKHGLVYTVDASYTPYTDTGLFAIYFGTDRNSVEKSIDIINRELTLLKNRPLTDNVLNSYKKQLLGQLAISSDNAESQCLAMGKSLLFHNRVEPIELLRERILKLDANLLQEVANEIFDLDRIHTYIYG